MGDDASAVLSAPDPAPQCASGKRPWIAPQVEELPRLSILTLQTGVFGGGNTGGGGSTVF